MTFQNKILKCQKLNFEKFWMRFWHFKILFWKDKIMNLFCYYNVPVLFVISKWFFDIWYKYFDIKKQSRYLIWGSIGHNRDTWLQNAKSLLTIYHKNTSVFIYSWVEWAWGSLRLTRAPIQHLSDSEVVWKIVGVKMW